MSTTKVAVSLDSTSQNRTLSTQRLGATIGRVSPEDLEQLVERLNDREAN